MSARRFRCLRLLLTAAVVSAAAGSCAGPERDPGPAAAGRCVATHDPDRDYFPVKSTLRHARNLTIRYEKNYQVVTVRQPFPGGRPESYLLVRCGTPAPELPGPLASAPRVEVPVRSLYSGSTTHLPLLADLGRVGVLTGVAQPGHVTNAEVRARIAAGDLTGYAAGQEVDTEKVVAAGPDVLMTGGTEDKAYGPLRRAGIAVVANAEWLEATPLARAEWIKLMAALTGTEATAARVFDGIEARYTAVAAKARGASTRPNVLTGTVFQGTWSVPGGGGYAARLIADAGGTYPWAGTAGTASRQLHVEAVLADAGAATPWLVDADWKTLADARRTDPRVAELAAYRGGAVWSSTRDVGPGGGNNYWERGVTRPDEVLADLVAILHPELMPGHAFRYYRRVPRG
jgi:iron complex transport system substrate-binding protein